MFGIVAPVADTDDKATQGAFAILNLLGDDNKFKQRLDQLTDIARQATVLRSEAEQRQKDAAKAQAKADAALAEAKSLRDEADNIKASTEAWANQAQIELTDREKALAAATKALIDATAKQKAEISTFRTEAEMSIVAAKDAAKAKIDADAKINAALKLSMEQAEKDLTKRELIVVDREKAASQLEANLALKQADLDTRLGKLKKLIEG